MSISKSNDFRSEQVPNPENPKYVFLTSLGCSKNFVDTEMIAASLVQNGFGLTDDPDEVDVRLINTCAFIAPARDEAEEHIQDAVDWKNHCPDQRKIVLSGCLTQWDTERTFQTKYPEIDLWLGIDEISKIGEFLRALFESSSDAPWHCATTPAFLQNSTTPRLLLTPPHYSYIKISDGCDNRCAYCAIPAIRGVARSRGVEEILAEAETVIASGAKELIIIAQDTTAFGLDRSKDSELVSLLQMMDSLPGEFWLRLMYAHPASFSDEMIDAFKSLDHLIPYLDLPVQHISDRILRRMNRHTSGAQIRDLLKKLRDEIPGLTLRTTLMTGFPGESEKEFEELREFVISERFERLGVFAYCPEPKTPAVTFDEQVDAALAESRRGDLMLLQEDISLEKNRKLVGKRFEALVDSINVNGRTALGRTYMDAPEIDNQLVIRRKRRRELIPGEMIKVKINSADIHQLKAVY